MTRPRLLDLFCGAGGAGTGYCRAGFEVIGVDIKPQKHYPFEFHQADALEFCAEHAHEFDAIHASPPCQRYTRAQNAAKNAAAHPDLVAPTRAALKAAGRPFVIENVVGAPLLNPATICGSSLGLGVRRHRLFETSFFLMVPPCQCRGQDYYVIFGHEVRKRRHGNAAGRKNSIAEGRVAMGISWMTRGELSEAIPPAYTEWIGRQLLATLRSEEE